jgi:hypothetical protein
MSEYDDIPGRWSRSPLTTCLLDDPGLLAHLHELAEISPGPREQLAWRLALDRAIRAMTTWPREQDYTQIADDMEAMGWLEPAAALRHLAGTDELVDAARHRWACRYVSRGLTAAELALGQMTEAGDIAFAGTDPVPGADGAWYERGYITAASDAGHVVVVRGRGLCEMIRFGDDDHACERWVASRGPLATAPIKAPPPVRHSRTWQEEQLLAAMLTTPGVLARYREQVPPDTFTTDSRYEIYHAMLTLAGNNSQVYPSRVADQVKSLCDQLPAEALSTYGGTGLPWLHRYLDRLTATDVTAAAAETAARAIAVEDTLVHESSAGPWLYSYVAGGPPSQYRPQPGTSPPTHRHTIPDQPGTPPRTPHIPPPEPSNQPGPVPRQ